MATISNNTIARAIYLASKDKNPQELSDLLKKVAEFLSRKRLLTKSKGIFLQLEKIINQEDERIVVKVTSAQKLDEKIKTHLAHTLKKRYSSKEITLVEKLDEKMLGGMRIEVNDEVIDLTVKNKIKKLQEYLTRNA